MANLAATANRVAKPRSTPPPIRVAEIVGALSRAVDLSHGHPVDRSLRTCLLALRLGRMLGLDDQTLSDVYYLSLLRFAGCTAGASHLSNLFADEIAYGPEIEAVELWQNVAMMKAIAKRAGTGKPPLRRAGAVVQAIAKGITRSRGEVKAHCEVSQVLATRLGLGPGVECALGEVFERWDGGGAPGTARGEALTIATRVVHLAYDLELFRRVGGDEAAIGVAMGRSGGLYDPAIVTLFLRDPAACLCAIDEPSPWDAILAAEPGGRLELSAERMEECAAVIGDFIDLRAPHTIGHSRRVGDLAAAAAAALGLSDDDLAAVRWAGFVHDVGMIAVPFALWNKPGSLSDAEWSRVHLHPYYTECVLARTPLAWIGGIAAAHHERMDGSGYHRRLPGSLLTTSHRVLGAAEAYASMVEERPYRAARSPDDAARCLTAMINTGALDREATRAVLGAAGHTTPSARRDRPFGLTAREIQVIAHLARGASNKELARTLGVSARTVDHHLRHIYMKLGVTTRAAATFVAMQHRLVDTAPGPE